MTTIGFNLVPRSFKSGIAGVDTRSGKLYSGKLYSGKLYSGKLYSGKLRGAQGDR